jgi:hemolysin III
MNTIESLESAAPAPTEIELAAPAEAAGALRPLLSRRRFAEELANSITGGVGWLMSVGGFAVLVVFASLYRSAWEIVACSVFGGTLMLAYGATTLYHAFPWPRVKQAFRILDHCSIYLLIAGTYTPFALGPLRGGWGWSLFGIVWGLAVVGIVFKTTLGTRFELLSTFVYLGMGWLGIVAIRPIMELVPGPGQLFLLLGGLAYTAGVGFYVRDHKLLFGHAIWHLFVLTGSTLHFFAILFWVVLWP